MADNQSLIDEIDVTNERILVADDEESCIASLQIMLKKAQVNIKDNVDYTIDGQECYEKLV